MSLGACAHLEKPVDRDTLTATALRFARYRPAITAATPTEEEIRAKVA